MRRRFGIAALAAGSVAIAACGGSDMAAEGSSESDPGAAKSTPTGAAQNLQSGAAAGKARKPTVVQVQDSQYGDVLFDRKGFVLYLFTRDTGKKSSCYGDCAEAWPAYRKRGPLKAGDGVDPSALEVTRRKDGSRQVAYEGHPLYYYIDDDEPGEILCHGVTEFGGDWLVVQPNGQPAP
jgi:predicted lipoprotein with Yx(FWY)xxD motif